VLAVILTAALAASSIVPPADGYRASVRVVDAATARAMTGVSWRSGCPVRIADLRLVGLTYWGFDGIRHRGELVVHKDVTSRVVTVFHTLYTARFPIRRMNRVDVYRGNDNASMAADNTSAFNCRPITGSARGFSEHAYGTAIDLNPMENPYLRNGVVLPPSGKRFTNRASPRPGLIRRGDQVWRTFAMRGFRWGGDWTSPRDYQHFEFPR
jgi:D-alanyl-D-alanine carboxypeptidase-like protein